MGNKREEIIEGVKTKIRHDINLNFRFCRPKSKEDFYQDALKEMEFLIRDRFNFQSAKKRDIIYYEMIEEYGAGLKEFIEETMMKTKKKLLQMEVNSTTAGIIIHECLAPEGLPYQVEMQTYRAKITIKLNEKNKAVFYITYKKLMDEIVKLVPAVRQLQQIVKTFGRNTFVDIIRSSDVWE